MLVQVEKLRPSVVQVTLNRPEKRNALSVALLKELKAALTTHLPASRVLILRGAGKGFCAGLDLKEASEVPLQELLGATLRDCLILLTEAPGITVAAVQGSVLAGGLGLALACDLCVAEQDASFGLPEARKGLVPSLILPILTERLQRNYLHELLFLGETINANRALEMELINRVVETGSIQDALEGLIQTALLSAPGAITQTKRLLAGQYEKSLSTKIQEAYESHCKMREAPEAVEGVAAFLEHRAPDWAH